MTHTGDSTLAAEVLTTYLNPAAMDDLHAVAGLGIATSIGSTSDPAYSDRQKIAEVFARLDASGEEFRRRRGLTAPRVEAVARPLQHLPIRSIKRVAKAVTSHYKGQADTLRAEILYQQPDVQAWPWHVQNGRAVALGTIADAHDLDAPGAPGVYPVMSGRLTTDITSHVFSQRAGWLEGMSLQAALIEASKRFYGTSTDRATLRAQSEIDDLRKFTRAPVKAGFKDIAAYSFDSLGIRTEKTKSDVRLPSTCHTAVTRSRCSRSAAAPRCPCSKCSATPLLPATTPH